jgi:hypothetical protein
MLLVEAAAGVASDCCTPALVGSVSRLLLTQAELPSTYRVSAAPSPFSLASPPPPRPPPPQTYPYIDLPTVLSTLAPKNVAWVYVKK